MSPHQKTNKQNKTNRTLQEKQVELGTCISTANSTEGARAP